MSNTRAAAHTMGAKNCTWRWCCHPRHACSARHDSALVVAPATVPASGRALALAHVRARARAIHPAADHVAPVALPQNDPS